MARRPNKTMKGLMPGDPCPAILAEHKHTHTHVRTILKAPIHCPPCTAHNHICTRMRTHARTWSSRTRLHACTQVRLLLGPAAVDSPAGNASTPGVRAGGGGPLHARPSPTNAMSSMCLLGAAHAPLRSACCLPGRCSPCVLHPSSALSA